MLLLINTNTMTPPVAPIGLDYIACFTRKAGINTEILDLCLEKNPEKALQNFLSKNSPLLVGLSFRNVDDCFWPSAQWFVPHLVETIDKIRALCDAPLVIGGVGFSVFAGPIVKITGADFGIRGDGENAVVQLYNQLRQPGGLENINGLIWRKGDEIISNRPAWPGDLSLPVERTAIDNTNYFSLGGQCGIETKRGCNRSCLYCADPVAKGPCLRLRKPEEVADEVLNLLNMGIDVLHICDSEFNLPYEHALDVCREFISRHLGKKLRWYTYMSITPFDSQLAKAMKRAGCAGIDFTTDSANPSMLRTYRQPHHKQDIQSAVNLCRENDIAVMLDLLLGGPGETSFTAADSIKFFKSLDPDCVGASLGVRIYPDTGMERIVIAQGSPEKNPNIKRKYQGALDLLKPTFYIAQSLGERPAELIRQLIGEDKRFFPPMVEVSAQKREKIDDHNYNENTLLADAIKKGARGAYWDILRRLR